MKRRDAGISELTGELLMIGLLLAIVIIILTVSFGLTGFLQRSAYVVPDFSFKNVSGHTVIAVFHRAGDPVFLTNTTNGSFQAGFYVDTIAGSYRAAPVSALSGFVPGDTVYIYYTGSGFAIAKNLTGISVAPFAASRILNVRLIDENTHVLIAQMNATTAASGVPAATSAIPVTNATTVKTTTITPTVTANVTANVTTAVTTATATATTSLPVTNATTAVTTGATATATPAYYTITVSWTPAGGGQNPTGSITPPGTNGGTVSIAAGGSMTFTIAPSSGKMVKSISLDGVQVSSGGAVNQVLTYTLSNVQSAHTISAHFG